MKPIGGFFELELPNGKATYHKKALPLTSGRSCLSLIIKKMNPAKLFIPYYTCNALIEPIKINKIKFDYYQLNADFEPEVLPRLKKNEYFIYINYWGIKRETVEYLIELYGDKLIVDNVHDFFNLGYEGIWSFTSARKYFGVSDGAYLYSPYEISDNIERNKEISLNHCINRLLGNQELGFKQFLEYEKSVKSDIKAVSVVSEKLLSNINYKKVKDIRKKNFKYLHGRLSFCNCLTINYYDDLVPFCYPFLPNDYMDKKRFYREGFFIPSFWQDTNNRGIRGFETEKKLSKYLFPLPVDHRYNKEDLGKLADYILNYH